MTWVLRVRMLVSVSGATSCVIWVLRVGMLVSSAISWVPWVLRVKMLVSVYFLGDLGSQRFLSFCAGVPSLAAVGVGEGVAGPGSAVCLTGVLDSRGA